MLPLTAHTALTAWQFAPVVTAGVALAAAAYLAGAWRVSRRHPARPWPAWRTAAFLGGLAAVMIATESSIGTYDDVLFTDHMVQHLLLIMVAPPLLVLGRPVTLLLHAAGNPVHTWVKRAVRSRVVAALTWPPAAVALYCLVVALTHLTPLMDLVLENDAVHNGEHALYLITGYLFFLPVLRSEPIRWRVSLMGAFLMILIVMPVDTAVGSILMTYPRELFPAYAHAGRSWGPSLVTDLNDGGFLMWAGSDAIMAVIAMVLAFRLLNPARSGHLDRRADAARRAILLRGLAAAGVAAPASRDVDDDDHLAAYNAYLSALDAGLPPGRRPLPPPGPPAWPLSPPAPPPG